MPGLPKQKACGRVLGVASSQALALRLLFPPVTAAVMMSVVVNGVLQHRLKYLLTRRVVHYYINIMNALGSSVFLFQSSP